MSIRKVSYNESDDSEIERWLERAIERVILSELHASAEIQSFLVSRKYISSTHQSFSPRDQSFGQVPIHSSRES